MLRADDIEFDGWRLNRNSGELRRAERSIRLRPQPLQVLEQLLAHPGEVVTRAHLIAGLWPKGILDFDTALNSAVRRLRKALCDDASTPKYIETLPRKGYRFIGSVTLRSTGGPIRFNAAPPLVLAIRKAVFPRRLQTIVAACALTAVGIWLAIDSRESTLGPPTIAPSLAATETVSKAQIFQFLEMQFARADGNHDGELDAAELAAFVHSVARQEGNRR
jgi:DNA-binding winged helix-turn-helix (wHTH) protein